MKNFNLLKGNQLEEAVFAIEKQILKEFGNTKDSELKIEQNKIIVKEGIRHEIDIYVTMNKGYGYKSIFLFECKNWASQKVGKNDISNFIDKIDLLDAQKGYFIGTEFTKDAIARGNLESRLEILKASPDEFAIFQNVEIEDPIKRKIELFKFYEPGEIVHLKPENDIKGDYDDVVIRLHDSIISKEVFLSRYLIKAINIELSKIEREKPGEYSYDFDRVFPFTDNSLKVNDIIMSHLRIKGNCTVLSCKPEIKFGFDIENRGKYMTIETDLPNDKKIKINLTALKKYIKK